MVLSRPRRRLVAALSCCLGALAPATSAPAAEPGLFVDRDARGGACSDARTPAQNTAATPWCSIEAALAKAPAGATVHVRAGAYPRVVAKDVVRPAYLTLKPYAGERPVIGGMDLERVERLRLEGLAFSQGVVVRGGSFLQFVGNHVQLTPNGRATGSGFTLGAVRQVLLQDNRVADGRDGVNLQSSRSTGDVIVWGNHFQRLGADGVHVGAHAERVLIVSNFFDDVRKRVDVDPDAHADAVQVMGPTRDVIAWGNYVAGGRGFLFMVSPRHHKLRGHGHERSVISSNVFAGPEFAIRAASVPGAQIVNNTVWGRSTSDHSGIDLRDRAGKANDRSLNLTVANNIAKRFRVTGALTFAVRSRNLVAKGDTGREDLAGTPRFLAPERGDFRLAPGSIGLDAADRRWAPAVDIEGRVRQAGPDIGAFEADGPMVAGFRKLPAEIAGLLSAATVLDEAVEDPDAAFADDPDAAPLGG